ncbi:MarR family transcriptional regulator [Actinoallomurus iriomotensis]|uniref:MarR family transcriptional regulator n=1 Tax=Actinoallomurus iriomotensis TaxID=478107 RepID=A0A9W6S2R3_9ACTN|nr:MarR family transcriptional regulator [Actinoallomurus iriomotensis]
MKRDEDNENTGHDEEMTLLVDAVFRLERAISRIGAMRLRPWRMTLSGYAALHVIEARPNLSLAQLSRRCFVRPQTMTRIVSNLNDAGYVKRKISPGNERAMSLTLTARGRKVLREMDVEVLKINETLGQNLPSEERAKMISLLRSSAVAVEQEIAVFEGL